MPFIIWINCCCSFNTQPPEGGWLRQVLLLLSPSCFNTQPPEGGWKYYNIIGADMKSFNTQPPEGGWFADLLR